MEILLVLFFIFIFYFKNCQLRLSALCDRIPGEETQRPSFELDTQRLGHDLVCTELGHSWELDRSQILWHWAWQPSHISLVLRRRHNVRKLILKSTVLTNAGVTQKQELHKNDHFIFNNKPTQRQRNLQKFPATHEIKMYAKSQWWSLLLNSHLQICLCSPPFLLIIAIYKYSLSLILAQKALQFLF